MDFDSKIQIARKTVESIIRNGKPFSYESLREEIVNKGGILRIAPGYTLGQYLDRLEEIKFIQYSAKLDKFVVNK